MFGSKPSQRKTRRIDFILGHAPTTQMGILGDCTGGGKKVKFCTL
jgi:hypothetical protein